MSTLLHWSDLLDAVDEVLHPLDQPATAVLFLRDDGSLGAMKVNGASTAAQVRTLCDLLAEAGRSEPPPDDEGPGCSTVLLATSRERAVPSLDDEWAWSEIQRQLSDAGVDLVDWLLVDLDVSISLAELGAS
jgi:hypothetical protein